MPPSKPKQLTSDGAMRAFLVVQLLRSTGEREFPAQLMAVFFWIAAHDGCRQGDLVDAVSLSASSVSRCVTWLGPKHRFEHRSGLHLIVRKRDPENHRAWRLHLTPKGKVFTDLLDTYADAPIHVALPAATKAKKTLMNSAESTTYDNTTS